MKRDCLLRKCDLEEHKKRSNLQASDQATSHRKVQEMMM